MWNFTYFDTSPKKTVFFPQYLDMFWFWSLLAVAMQLRFCHTSFCSFWLMLVFSHTRVNFHLSWSRNGAFVCQVFQWEFDKCGASHVENMCVVLMFTTTHTHAVYIHTETQDVDGGSSAEQGIMLLKAQLSTEKPKTWARRRCLECLQGSEGADGQATGEIHVHSVTWDRKKTHNGWCQYHSSVTESQPVF